MKTKTNVMANAWTIARKGAATHGGSAKMYFAASLKMAWNFEKFGTISEPAEQATSEKPKKDVVKKVRKQRAPKAVPMIEESERIIFAGIPANIAEIFGDEVAATVENFVDQFVNGYTNKSGKHIGGANNLQGAHLDAKRFQFEDGMEALASVEDFEGLQAAMVTYFLRDIVAIFAGKMLEMGIGFKKLNKAPKDANATQAIRANGEMKQVNKHENSRSWEKSSTQRGNITQFEIDEVVNSVIVKAYTLIFDENMFETPENVMGALYWRTSNEIQSMLRQVERERKARKEQTENMIEIVNLTDVITDEAIAIDMAKDLGIFSDAELEIIKLRVCGLQKKEIDAKLAKRTDRDFQRIGKKYDSENGTINGRKAI